MADDYDKILKAFYKQFEKVVSVASSVGGLAKMIAEQGTKGRTLLSQAQATVDLDIYKQSEKAFEAVSKGRSALIKEVEVLKSECDTLEKAQKLLEKAAEKAKKEAAKARKK